MAVNLIGGVTAPSNPTLNLQTLGLGQEDFFRILVTQLSYQDPLKPIDNQEFIAQLAQFTSLDQTRQVNERIRDVTQGPDGALYLLTDNPKGRVLKVVPKK